MKNNENKKNSKMIITAIIAIIAILILVGIALYFGTKNINSDDKTLAYTDLIKEMSYGNIEKVEMTVGSTSVKIKMKR